MDPADRAGGLLRTGASSTAPAEEAAAPRSALRVSTPLANVTGMLADGTGLLDITSALANLTIGEHAAGTGKGGEGGWQSAQSETAADAQSIALERCVPAASL
jgi:hypothetical protein